MIIDFHTHIFPEKIAGNTIKYLEDVSGNTAFTAGTKESLQEEMKKSGVNLSIILPVVTKPEQFRSINAFACSVNEEYQNMISFGGIHPNSEDYKKELKEIANMGMKGIKLHPDYQNTQIDDIKYMHIIDYASQLGLIISIHAGVDIGYPEPVHAVPKALRRVVREVQPEKMVLAHFGGFDLWDEVEEHLIGEHVYLDTAYIDNKIVPEQFLRMVSRHGSDKILFATDSPWSGQTEMLDWLDSLRLAASDYENILYRNAENLLGFSIQSNTVNNKR